MAREKIYFYLLALDTKKVADPWSRVCSLQFWPVAFIQIQNFEF